jgi:phage terminase small subunit
MMDKLTVKQSRFVEEYMKDSCATKAAIRAGYSERRASEIGYQLLQKTTVSEAIKQNRDEVGQHLRDMFVADAIMARQVLYEVMTDPEASNRDKLTAAKDLLDRAGFKPVDKQELTGVEDKPIKVFFNIPRPPRS